MLEVQICVGSSCHLKGAYQVVQIFQEMVKAHRMDERVVLKASFCQKNCTHGVSMKIGERKVIGVSPETAREVFRQEVLTVIARADAEGDSGVDVDIRGNSECGQRAGDY